MKLIIINTIAAIAMNVEATIATGFNLNLNWRSFLTSGPSLTVKNPSRKNLIPWLSRVAAEKIIRLISNAPEDIEKILYGRGREAAMNKIQKSHFVYSTLILA
jgi:hypothetical protein